MTDNWQERREASFRGVPFLLQTIKGKTGRRAIPHEYPKNDLGQAEDNGRVLNAETITAVLVGPYAEDEFQRLVEALNLSGGGELIHPWFGIRQVQVGEVDYDLNNNEREICRLSFQVYESNKQFYIPKKDIQQSAIEQANTANDKQCDYFEKEVNKMKPENIATLSSQLDGMLDDLDNIVNDLPSLPDAVVEWVGRLDRIKFSLSRGLAYPGEFAKEITNTLFRIKDLTTELPLSLNVYSQLENKWTGLREEIAFTTADSPLESNKKNAERIGVDLMLTAAVTAQANAVATELLVDSKQATEVLESLSNSLGKIANNAVDSGNSESWRHLRKLRLTAAQDIQDRVRQLPILRTLTIEQTIPSALLAYQLTGDTNQRDDIVKRNRISRPSFIQGSVDVLVENHG